MKNDRTQHDPGVGWFWRWETRRPTPRDRVHQRCNASVHPSVRDTPYLGHSSLRSVTRVGWSASVPPFTRDSWTRPSDLRRDLAKRVVAEDQSLERAAAVPRIHHSRSAAEGAGQKIFALRDVHACDSLGCAEVDLASTTAMPPRYRRMMAIAGCSRAPSISNKAPCKSSSSAAFSTFRRSQDLQFVSMFI